MFSILWRKFVHGYFTFESLVFVMNDENNYFLNTYQNIFNLIQNFIHYIFLYLFNVCTFPLMPTLLYYSECDLRRTYF